MRTRFAIAAILAEGLLALAWPAEAQIVYTPTNITIELCCSTRCHDPSPLTWG